MYHIAGLVEPPSISPGHFFTIHRNMIPSVNQIRCIISFALKPNRLTLQILTVLGACSNDYLFACSYSISNER